MADDPNNWMSSLTRRRDMILARLQVLGYRIERIDSPP